MPVSLSAEEKMKEVQHATGLATRYGIPANELPGMVDRAAASVSNKAHVSGNMQGQIWKRYTEVNPMGALKSDERAFELKGIHFPPEVIQKAQEAVSNIGGRKGYEAGNSILRGFAYSEEGKEQVRKKKEETAPEKQEIQLTAEQARMKTILAGFSRFQEAQELVSQIRSAYLQELAKYGFKSVSEFDNSDKYTNEQKAAIRSDFNNRPEIQGKMRMAKTSMALLRDSLAGAGFMADKIPGFKLDDNPTSAVATLAQGSGIMHELSTARNQLLEAFLRTDKPSLSFPPRNAEMRQAQQLMEDLRKVVEENKISLG